MAPPAHSRYFVASKANHLQRMGIPEEQITISGIPVDPVFRIQKDKRETRRALSLDPDRFTILISAGGFGVGPVEILLSELLTMKQRAQVVAIAGKSEELKAKLEKIARKAAAEAEASVTSIPSASPARWMTTWPPPTC